VANGPPSAKFASLSQTSSYATDRAVDFLNARPYLGYETNFDKRHGLL